MGQQRIRASQVLVKCVLGTDALCLAVGNNWSQIDPTCQFPQIAPTRDAPAEPFWIRSCNLPDGTKPKVCQSSLGFGTHAPQTSDGQRGEKRTSLSRCDFLLPVRLGQVR